MLDRRRRKRANIALALCQGLVFALMVEIMIIYWIITHGITFWNRNEYLWLMRLIITVIRNADEPSGKRSDHSIGSNVG